MKTKITLVLLSLILQTFAFAATTGNSEARAERLATAVPNSIVNDLSFANIFANNADCTIEDLFAPTAAPCNGVSVTAVSFNNAGRTVESGTSNTVGVVYRYPSVGIAPDGTNLDALVTVVSYNNNQDATPTTFRDADLPAATAGFDGNLQPSLNQETGVFNSNAAWSGNITYRIRFVTASTSTPKTISVAATTIDNDGSNICGGLREFSTYSSGFNQNLISGTSNQTVAGNTITGPTTTQTNIGTGIDFSNAALYINVTEFNWTQGFTTAGGCTNGGTSEVRYGSLNLSCQINFGRNFLTVPVSGTVFNDTNGLTDSTVNGTGTDAGGLFANLLDTNGNVVSSVTVAANGTYTFPGVPTNASYSVQISTNAGIESSPAPVSALPAGWVNTGENLGAGAGNDGTVNGSLAVTVAGAAVTNANFGIEQRPVANNNTATSQVNPGGTTSVSVPVATFSATDTAPGTVSNIRITAFPSNATTITINGTTYTSATFPVGGVIVPTNAAGNPTQAISVDPINGAVTVGITYVAIDNAGVQSSVVATASLPFTTVSLSGTVLNDTNGLTDATVNGTGTNAGGLFANLISGGVVVQSVAVAANGTYSFAGLNSGAYTVQVSTNAGTVGNAPPATVLPTGWVNTGENLGAGAGNDGSANGSLNVTVGTANVINANFGIEQRPTANNNTATSQGNPGGTTNATVPATTFSGADTGTNTVSSIRISTFPTNATTITINGTQYTSATFPVGGVTVPTNAAGNPTQPILVDPIDGAVTVAITYFTIDQAGVESSASGTASVPFNTLGVSGTVFNDTNGLSDSIVNGTGTNAGGLFANLLDSNGNVVQSVAVPAGGAYSFTGLNGGNYTVQISTNAGTVGNPAPATALPSGWVNTGENFGAGAGNDGTANGLLPLALGTASITNANFGIEQRPVAANNTAASQVNPGGTTSSTVPATTFSATDTAPGTVSNIRITAFPSNATTITINGTTYTSATFPVGGVIVPTNAAGNPTQAISVDPINGAVTVGISYVAIDNAGVESSATATASVPFSTVSLSGSVFNDINGQTDATVNGTGTNAGGLFANLISGGVVVQSVAVAANGTYSFAGLNGGSYSVQISTNVGTVGSPAPVGALPTGWVNTGENVGAGSGSDGTANGILPVTIGAASITNANFGIEQRPTANTNTAAPQNNYGGTSNGPVAATTFTATDPAGGTVSSIRITAFPTGATSITINGTLYTAANFPVGGVTVPTNAAGNTTQPILVDPAATGATTVVIPYVAIDNAGVESSATANANVPFIISPSAANANITGRLTNGEAPLANTLVLLRGNLSGSTVFTRTDSSGVYSFDAESGNTYVVQALSSKYEFAPSTRFVNLVQDLVGVDFSGSNKRYSPKSDFDGDGKSDLAVYRPEEGAWYILSSSNGQLGVFYFGLDGDKPVSADYDGDGKSDLAVYRPSEGNWYIRQSTDDVLRVERFGLANDRLVPADYDGDGKTDVAVFREGVWYISRSSDGRADIVNLGLDSDIPTQADFDGDGKADVAVYRPATGVWYIYQSSNNQVRYAYFGLASDVPMPADYDGDGYADIVQFRDSTWYFQNSVEGFKANQFGRSGDRSISGDFDGDGRTDQTVYRNGTWTVRNSTNGIVNQFNFGLATDIPIN